MNILKRKQIKWGRLAGAMADSAMSKYNRGNVFRKGNLGR
jgi:hypothetical protein